MSTPGERLRKARRKLYPTATAFAEAIGMSRNTYLQYENGTRSLSSDAAERFAPRLQTTPEALLFNREGPGEVLKEIVGYAGADPDGAILFAEGQGTGDFAPLPRDASANAQPIEIKGFSMPFFAEDGSLVWVDGHSPAPRPDMMNQVVVCQLDTGEVLIKRLQKGTEPGKFNLASLSGPLRENVTLQWVAEIISIVPPLHARRVIQRGGFAA